MLKAIHHNDAMRLLESGEPCNLRLWKISTGDILEYKGVRCVGGHWRGGTHLLRMPNSNLLRRCRDITVFEINGMKIFM